MNEEYSAGKMNGCKGRVLSSFQISSWAGIAFILGYPSSNPQSDRPPTSRSASQPHTHYTYSHLWFRVCVPVINPLCMNLFFIPPLFYSVSYDEVALFPLMCLTTTVWTVVQVTHPHNLTNQHYPSFSYSSSYSSSAALSNYRTQRFASS